MLALTPEIRNLATIINATAGPSRSPRILSCMSCSQRKVKCNRVFPCANCVCAGTECVPGAQLARPRRPRFPERELLARIRHYESLLHQNNVIFYPLHSEESDREVRVSSLDPSGDTQSDISSSKDDQAVYDTVATRSLVGKTVLSSYFCCFCTVTSSRQ